MSSETRLVWPVRESEMENTCDTNSYLDAQVCVNESEAKSHCTLVLPQTQTHSDIVIAHKKQLFAFSFTSCLPLSAHSETSH